jgi:hypothetical protein
LAVLAGLMVASAVVVTALRSPAALQDGAGVVGIPRPSGGSPGWQLSR